MIGQEQLLILQEITSNPGFLVAFSKVLLGICCALGLGAAGMGRLGP
jgi:hypothetical protein